MLAAVSACQLTPAHPPAAATPLPSQVLWVANVHLEGSPYRPNDRISQVELQLRIGAKLIRKVLRQPLTKQ